MKIQSSSITMSGKSNFIQQHSKEESLKFWVGRRPDFENQNSKTNKPSQLQLDILKFSEQAKKEMETQRKNALAAAESTKGAQATNEISQDNIYDLSDEAKAKIEMLQKMIESLTGKKLRFFLPIKLK